MMNGALVHEESEHLAEADRQGRRARTAARRCAAAFEIVLSRLPRAEELATVHAASMASLDAHLPRAAELQRIPVRGVTP